MVAPQEKKKKTWADNQSVSGGMMIDLSNHVNYWCSCEMQTENLLVDQILCCCQTLQLLQCFWRVGWLMTDVIRYDVMQHVFTKMLCVSWVTEGEIRCHVTLSVFPGPSGWFCSFVITLILNFTFSFGHIGHSRCQQRDAHLLNAFNLMWWSWLMLEGHMILGSSKGEERMLWCDSANPDTDSHNTNEAM